MPRQNRKKSLTGIHHVMLRGLDKRDIFIDNEDRRKFIDSIAKSKETGKFSLLGYCLMNNHVHILMKEGEELGISIKRIAISYAQWHNGKYARVGHLFQNRFLSEPVENEEYLISVLRYIHQNPVNAYMVASCEEYEWSSYMAYINLYENRSDVKIIDPEIIFELIDSKNNFEKTTKELVKGTCLEYSEKKIYTDSDLAILIRREYFKDKVLTDPNEKQRLLKQIYLDTGASIRQIGRVMGLSKGAVVKSLKN
ncbi:MAG: transposase [Eubacteriaceae bacterium]|nr:transposase [Eubacteriaceae bacterium]